MIFCYHTQITAPWTDDELRQKASVIPQDIRERILRKRNHLDAQLSISGYLLLLGLIKHFEVAITLQDIVLNDYKRPGFNTSFDFNISHSGNRVICCATTNGAVGVDIEQIKPIDINLEDYFTPAEQQHIRAAKKPNAELINYWTRKEAVLKAIGTGVFTPLLDIDVSTDSVSYQHKDYYLTALVIDNEYRCTIACTINQEIRTRQIEPL